MDRRGYLVRAGAVSIGGFALLAGCSDTGDNSGDGNEGSNNSDGSSGTSGSGSGGEGGASEATPTEAGEILTTGDEALDTGQAPPSVTATEYENTATVPESQGLETGQAPNAGGNGNNSSN